MAVKERFGDNVKPLDNKGFVHWNIDITPGRKDAADITVDDVQAIATAENARYPSHDAIIKAKLDIDKSFKAFEAEVKNQEALKKAHLMVDHMAEVTAILMQERGTVFEPKTIRALANKMAEGYVADVVMMERTGLKPPTNPVQEAQEIATRLSGVVEHFMHDQNLPISTDDIKELQKRMMQTYIKDKAARSGGQATGWTRG